MVDIQVVTAVDCFHIVLMLSDFFFSISVVPAHLVSWSKGFNIELILLLVDGTEMAYYVLMCH